MSDQVAVAIITTVGVVLAALIGVQSHQIGRIRRDASAARSQLDNDHTSDPTKTSNLREDLDEKHRESMATIRAAVRDIGGIREDIRQLRRDQSHTAGRVDDLERLERTRDKEEVRHEREQQQHP